MRSHLIQEDQCKCTYNKMETPRFINNPRKHVSEAFRYPIQFMLCHPESGFASEEFASTVRGTDLDPRHFLHRFLAVVFLPVKVFAHRAIDPSGGRRGGGGRGRGADTSGRRPANDTKPGGHAVT